MQGGGVGIGGTPRTKLSVHSRLGLRNCPATKTLSLHAVSLRTTTYRKGKAAFWFCISLCPRIYSDIVDICRRPSGKKETRAQTVTNCSIHNTDLLQHCGFHYPTLNPNINLFHCGRGVAFAMLFCLPLYPPPIFAIKSVYTMAGSELSGRPPGQLTYSFIRGAAKQHGTLVFNDVCTYTMWGHKVLVRARLF